MYSAKACACPTAPNKKRLRDDDLQVSLIPEVEPKMTMRGGLSSNPLDYAAATVPMTTLVQLMQLNCC